MDLDNPFGQKIKLQIYHLKLYYESIIIALLHATLFSPFMLLSVPAARL